VSINPSTLLFVGPVSWRRITVRFKRVERGAKAKLFFVRKFSCCFEYLL
jgi:hypothetical protein